MASSLGAVAKEGRWWKRRLSGSTAKAIELIAVLTGLKRRAKGLVIGYAAKGALGGGLALGTVTAAVLMLFFAAYLGLAKVLDPALAALIPAAVVLAALGLVALFAGRPRG